MEEIPMRQSFSLRTWLSAAFVGLALTGSAAAAGAIAVDDPPGKRPGEVRALGVAVGEANPVAARAKALTMCRKQGGISCKLVLSFRGCGAYATSPARYGVGMGGSILVAERGAMRNCGNQQCQIIAAKCE
jgi:hypothetical protein